MKNAFFADRHDFSKYDLLLEIMEKASFVQQLTMLPMLTPKSDSRGGTLLSYECGHRRTELYEFLKKCLAEGHRDIRELREFFPRFGFKYFPYNDSKFFTQDNRHKYFHDVPTGSLLSSVVFLDPDNGLEVPSMNPNNADKYVRYSEVQQLLGRMDNSSILIVYQHLPRQEREAFFERLRNTLCEKLKTKNISCVADGNVCFAICVKGSKIFGAIQSLLTDYTRRLHLRMPFHESTHALGNIAKVSKKADISGQQAAVGRERAGSTLLSWT